MIVTAFAEETMMNNMVYVEILEVPSIEEPTPTLCTSLEPKWMDPIINYLIKGDLPTDPIQAHKVKHQASWYIHLEEKLYKKSFSLPCYIAYAHLRQIILFGRCTKEFAAITWEKDHWSTKSFDKNIIGRLYNKSS